MTGRPWTILCSWCYAGTPTNLPMASLGCHSPAFCSACFSLLKTTPQENGHYSSHSPRIGWYNELSVLGFSKKWIVQRLDWETEAMVRVYHDSLIVAIAHSGWFFANLRWTSPTPLDSSAFDSCKQVYTYEVISRITEMLTVTVIYVCVSAASYLIRNWPAGIVASTHFPFPHVHISSHLPAATLVIMSISLLF